jgi:hypothetical protein
VGRGGRWARLCLEKEERRKGFRFKLLHLFFIFENTKTQTKTCNQKMMHKHFGDSKLIKYYFIVSRATGFTPFCLLFGTEAMTPDEIKNESM